ncbi:unnamed protein product [Fraxinus pennsylvanica]|uniref:Uncharacterized protein n=1 Tax=Fraxinus pennsylvanica TaxID=56036 RepID=A0AAD1YNK9_9LAMI|nr:unnamed protein product [Fraxinus pennsylvanica]
MKSTDKRAAYSDALSAVQSNDQFVALCRRQDFHFVMLWAPTIKTGFTVALVYCCSGGGGSVLCDGGCFYVVQLQWHVGSMLCGGGAVRLVTWLGQYMQELGSREDLDLVSNLFDAPVESVEKMESENDLFSNYIIMEKLSAQDIYEIDDSIFDNVGSRSGVSNNDGEQKSGGGGGVDRSRHRHSNSVDSFRVLCFLKLLVVVLLMV